MIRKENVTRLAIESTVRGGTSLVFGSLSSEGEVDGDALPRYSGFASGMVAGRGLLQFRCNAGGTGVKDGVSALEGRNTIDVLVGSIEVSIAGMSKALVPE
jgi:hypothetical protein